MSKTISVNSFLAGTGKSNATANLAALFASSGLRVGVIDAHIQSPSIHVLFGLQANKINPSLNDQLLCKCPTTELAHDVTANLGAPVCGKVFLVPSSMRAGAIDRVLSEGYDVGLLNERVNSLVSNLALDIVLLDTHAGINGSTLLSISIADALVIMLRPDMQDYQGTAVTVDVARKLEVPTIVLLVNNVPAAYDTADVRARIQGAYNCEVAAMLPYSDELMALGSGGIFALKYSDNALTAGLKTLVARLLQ